jgi:hypothetical protein
MTPPSPLSAPVPPPTTSPALGAFLRGVGRRAIVFAQLQCGDPGHAGDALATMLPRFTAEAGVRPMAQWPARFWGLLLASPALRGTPGATPRWPPAFAVLGGIGAGPRSAALLWLVAGLDEDDAAAALGVDAPTWRLAVQRATPRDAQGEVDAGAWHRLAEASRDAQQALSAASLALWDRDCRAALAHPSSTPTPTPTSASAAAAQPRWWLPALWAAFATCIVALAVTFAWPALQSRPDAPASGGDVRVRRVPLPVAAAPRATFDAAFALRSHPDLEQLATADETLLRDLDLYAWHAAESGAGSGGDTAGAARPMPAPSGSLQQRIAAWDALPASERSLLRERWQAWQAMPATQRARVLDAAATLAALAPDAQQALRIEFAQLAPDERRGWLLGPQIGVAWPRLEPLLMQVPAAQREPLLAMLHALSPLELDDLATLAQRTPPQGRDELRRELLSTSQANRAAWLHERLQR